MQVHLKEGKMHEHEVNEFHWADGVIVFHTDSLTLVDKDTCDTNSTGNNDSRRDNGNEVNMLHNGEIS